MRLRMNSMVTLLQRNAIECAHDVVCPARAETLSRHQAWPGVPEKRLLGQKVMRRQTSQIHDGGLCGIINPGTRWGTGWVS
jgi:hypothetical protein